MLLEAKVDYSKARNLILTSVVLIVGISGAHISIGTVDMKGMALATVVAILVSLVFKLLEVASLMNDAPEEQD